MLIVDTSLKSIRDLTNLARQTRRLGEEQRRSAGYEPGMRGAMGQLGDLVVEANAMLGDLRQQSAKRARALAEGLAGEAEIVAMGTPIRGATEFNLDLDLEVRLPGRSAYRVAGQYIVPAWAPLRPGVTLPVSVDRDDPAIVAIDWQRVAPAPAHGKVRPVDDEAAPAGADGDETLDQLERLVRLRDAGALTEAEFAEQKARILESAPD